MQIRPILKQLNIRPRKSWGQNFLINDKVAQKIISFCDLNINDVVLEIGPGLGSLTRYLIETSGRVIAVEIDKKISAYLKQEFAEQNNIDIVCRDILKFDLKGYLNKNKIVDKTVEDNNRIKIVGNLPYYITSPIIEYLIKNRADISSVIIMVQKEVANRLSAKPGTKDYGSLSCFVQFYADVKKILTIRPSGFHPCPDVDSTVLAINFFEKPAYSLDNEENLFKIIRAGFNQRRKQILKALLNNLKIVKMTRLELEQILIKADIDPAARAEVLSLADFVRLAKILTEP
ncbi:MAG: 16S rRNA (adenine(1518)-N(6)/adenine(1519)-N(6))-dimethyltransferase RsmA [Candidatus Omnitrophica bacterium]|nr:16S rRNA (adenine(1518)-N(6)/adenine(1519)-N(6))-dimethyltransferase RsmA [Candidatus Omnitrophota bacterium]